MKVVALSFVSALQVCAAPTKRFPSKVKYAGVNIAGFDFGAGQSYCSKMDGNAFPPLVSNGVVPFGGPDGVAQMKFVDSDSLMNED